MWLNQQQVKEKSSLVSVGEYSPGERMKGIEEETLRVNSRNSHYSWPGYKSSPGEKVGNQSIEERG